ncbi:MAG: hypothetical protein ACK544_02080 [Microcystis sp.]
MERLEGMFNDNDPIPELPNIDALDVLDLGGQFPKMLDNLVMSSRVIKVEGEFVQQVANLWRQLKPGQSARCHMPPFGLRFYCKGELILQASMCWECNNMYLWQKDNPSPSLHGVDLEPPSAKKLFSLLEGIMR